MADRPFPRPQVEAHQGLYPLGRADHGHEDQGVYIADDGIAHHRVLSNDPKYGLVEEKDNDAIGTLTEPVGEAQGENPAVDSEIRPEPAQPQALPVGEKIEEEYPYRGGLGQSGGQSGPPHSPAEHQHEQGIQPHVHQGAGEHADGAHLGSAVGFHLDLQIIGDGEAGRKAGDGAHILLDIVQGGRGGPQEEGHPLQVQQHGDTQQHTGPAGDPEVLVKIIPRPLQIPLTQGDGEDGGGTGSQQNAQGEHQGGKGHGEIYGGQGVFSHAPGHKHPVHHGVQGENPHGHNGGDDEFEKTMYELQWYDLLFLEVS